MIAQHLKAIQVGFEGAFAAEREFIRGKPDPLTNVSMGLARRGLNKPNEQRQPHVA